MARYFFGNTLASFFRTSTQVVEDTTAGKFDATFVSNAIKVPGNTNYIQTMPFIDASSCTDLWTHFEFSVTSTANGGVWIEWLNSSLVVVARITYGASGLTFQYWNGTAFVSAFTWAVFAGNTLVRFDVHIVAGAAGSANVYQAGTLVGTVSGMNAAVTNFAYAKFYTFATASGYWSQILGADFDTRDSRYMCQLAAALGTLTDGTGSAADIGETVLDETTSLALSTTGQRRSYTHSTLTLPTGYAIGAVCLGGRGRRNGTGPADGKLGLYDTTAAIAYTGAALGLNTGYEPRGSYWATNPNTGSDWTQGDYNDVEFYAEAA